MAVCRQRAATRPRWARSSVMWNPGSGGLEGFVSSGERERLALLRRLFHLGQQAGELDSETLLTQRSTSRSLYSPNNSLDLDQNRVCWALELKSQRASNSWLEGRGDDCSALAVVDDRPSPREVIRDDQDWDLTREPWMSSSFLWLDHSSDRAAPQDWSRPCVLVFCTGNPSVSSALGGEPSIRWSIVDQSCNRRFRSLHPYPPRTFFLAFPE